MIKRIIACSALDRPTGDTKAAVTFLCSVTFKIRYDTIQYIYYRSKADEMASLI